MITVSNRPFINSAGLVSQPRLGAGSNPDSVFAGHVATQRGILTNVLRLLPILRVIRNNRSRTKLGVKKVTDENKRTSDMRHI